MAALVNVSDVINRATGGAGAKEDFPFFVDSRASAVAATATVLGRFTTLWPYNWHSGPGAYPGASARNPTRATQGAIALANLSGGRQKWLTCVSFSCNTVGTLFFMDRLADYSGLSGTTTGAQNTTSLAVTRYTGASSVGNQIWIEIPTIIGASSTTVTASYTNEGGTSGRTTQVVAIGNTGLREAQRALPLPLQTGDAGVRSVQSITLAATTGTVGDIAVTIQRPLFAMPHNTAAGGAIRDFIAGQPNPVDYITDTCLSCIWLAGSTTAPAINGFASSVEA